MGEQESSITSTISHTRARPTKAASPVLAARQPSPERWTSKNPDWRKQWHDSLVFPATGKNRTTVDGDDILRLDEGEFLNDNLISFYLRYLQFKLEKERPELLKKVYIFSTFFFEKLRSTKGKINYEGVKAWTTKFDLFLTTTSLCLFTSKRTGIWPLSATWLTPSMESLSNLTSR